MSNLENPSAIKISKIGPHILSKQKGSEEHTISIVFIKHEPNHRIFDGRWTFEVNIIKIDYSSN